MCNSQIGLNVNPSFLIENPNGNLNDASKNDTVVKTLSKLTPSFDFKRMNGKSDDIMPSSKKKRTNKFTKAQEVALNTVPISNRFSALNNDNMDINEVENSQDTASQAEASLSKDKPPPIIIHLPNNWQSEMESLRENTNSKFFCKLSGEYLKILPTTLEDFRKIQSHFAETGTNYQTLDLKSKRPKKVILRGLPIETPISTIIDDLTLKGFKPMYAVYLKHRISRNPMPLVLVCLEPTPNWTNIYEVKDISKSYIKVESFHGSRVKQCYRCHL